ncbi:hypothetical protein AB3S75_040908 [Citrus x aurantiifolia]
MSEQQTTVDEAMSRPLAPYLQEEGKRSCIFYKLIVPSILQDKKLRIPDKFVQKFGDELSSIAKFTIPSGRMWFVELKKCNKQLWFDIGWHEFIEHCSIHSGYFLIFKYQGNSNFNVYIFDLAISEIEYPSLEEPSDSKQCHVPIEKDKEKNSSLRILPPLCAPCPDPFSPATKVLDEGVCYKCNKDSTSGVKIEYLHIPKDEHNQETAFHCPQDKGIQFKNTSDEVGLYFNCGTKRKISGPGQITNYCKIEQEAEFPSYRVSFKTYTRRWRAVTTEEKKRTVHAAEMYKSNNPLFRVILRPSYVYRTLLLHVPTSFARKYLNGIKGYITIIDSNGKQWPVRCIFKNGGAKFSKGWPEFVWENNLDESDVCVFELIKTNDVTLKATIFRVLEDARPVY